MEQILRAQRVRRVGLYSSRRPPRRLRLGLVAAPEQGEPVLELDERAARLRLRQRVQVSEAARPRSEQLADSPLERVVAGEDRARLRHLPRVVEIRGTA